MSKTKSIPWADTDISVEKSLMQIRGVMQKYGAEQWSFPEQSNGDIDIFFIYRGQKVSLSLHAQQMYKRLCNLHPKSDRNLLMEKSKRIMARQAVNYLKVTFEVIETGLFSPVEALLPHFVNDQGQKVSDFVLDAQPNLKRLLPPA